MRVKSMADVMALADQAPTSLSYWIENEGGGCDDGDYCYSCVQKMPFVGEKREAYCAEESDSCKHCVTCGCVLEYTLTDYGVQEEMGHFIDNGVPIEMSPDVAYHLCRIEDSRGEIEWTDVS